MNRRFSTVVAPCAAFAVPLAGCGKKDKESKDPEEHTDKDPLAELQSIPALIQAELDSVLQPFNDIDVVVEQMNSLSAAYGVDTKVLAGIAKASLEGDSVTVDIEVSADGKAEVEALLATAKGIGTGLEETPKRVALATKNIVGLAAKATALSAKVQTKLQAKLKSPLMKAEKKAKLQGDLQLATRLQAEITGIVAQAKSTATEVPAKGTESLAVSISNGNVCPGSGGCVRLCVRPAYGPPAVRRAGHG